MAHILVAGLCRFPAPDRWGVQMEHVIEGLTRDHEVDVLVLRRHGQVHEEYVRGARVLRVANVDNDREVAENFGKALRNQLDEVRYDIVHFRDVATGIVVLDRQSEYQYATVYDVARSPMTMSASSDVDAAEKREGDHQICLNRANLLLAHSEPARQEFSLATDSQKVHVVPPGVNIDHFDWEHAVLEGRPVILCLRADNGDRNDSDKRNTAADIQLLIKSMLEVQAHSDAVLLLGGPLDRVAEYIQGLIIDLGMQSRVRVLGEVPSHLVSSVIVRATVCVVPSAAPIESLPTVLYPTTILEYMACRRAIVAPRHSIVESVMQDQAHGLLFRSGDPEDLASKILFMFSDAAVREDLALRAYQRVRNRFSASGTRRKLREAYRWLLDHHPYRHSEKVSPAPESSPLAPQSGELGMTATYVRDGDRRALQQPEEGRASGESLVQTEITTLIADEELWEESASSQATSLAKKTFVDEAETTEAEDESRPWGHRWDDLVGDVDEDAETRRIELAPSGRNLIVARGQGADESGQASEKKDDTGVDTITREHRRGEWYRRS